MNEANHNANSFNRDLWLDNQSEQSSEVNKVAESNSREHLDHDRDSETAAKMDWQRVAHKLREYNRKLLKKVFRLEQELAEIDNKFNKHVEKSENTDLLLVRQADELEASQAKIALSIEKLADSQQQIDNQELVIKQVSEQYELSQQQTAQLERECTLIQEKYNQKAFELVAKEQENQKLQSELDRIQHSALQQEAELKTYQEAASRKEKAVNRNQNYPHNRFIQPWSTVPRAKSTGLALPSSTSTFPEPKIALPKTKIQGDRVKQTPVASTETIKTAAEIATWSASVESRQKVNKSQPSPTQTAKAKQGRKPQSLAAVDLPTFPRPK